MKRKLTLILITAVSACALLLTSCRTTQTGDVAGFWNSPAVQNELTLIQNAAFAFINGYINQVGGLKARASVGASSSNAAADACYANLKVKFPTTPDVVLRGAADKAARGK